MFAVFMYIYKYIRVRSRHRLKLPVESKQTAEATLECASERKTFCLYKLLKYKPSAMSNPTLPFMLHPKYFHSWRPGQAWKSTTPQQNPYSESETMSTDEDTAEFMRYRKYRYGRSHESSMALLEEMGKAQVSDSPWPSNSWVLGGEVRQVSRQQEQLEEVRGLRPFSVGYPKETGKRAVDGDQNTATAPTTAQTSRPAPQTGRMLGLGGTTSVRHPQSGSRRPVPSSTPTIRTTRAQELRAQAVRNTAAANNPRGRTPTPQRPSLSPGAQNSTRPTSSVHTQSNEVSTSGTPSPYPDSSTRETTGQGDGVLDHVGEPESHPSSPISVSVISTNPDEPDLTNSVPKASSVAKVQVGVEIEFLVAMELKDKEPPAVHDRYYIPLKDQQATTIIDGLPARRYISQLLRDEGIPAVTDHDQHDEVRQAAACCKQQLDKEDEYAVWTVKCEPAGTVLDHVEDFDYVGLEFASRKLQASPEGFQEIQNVIRVLRRHVLVATNTTCGVHVHVDATTLETLQERKHFMCLYLLAEKELFSLTAPHRRHSNPWAAPVSKKSKLAEDAEETLEESAGHVDGDDKPTSAAKMAAMKALIQNCESTKDIQATLSRNMLPPYHRAALNLKDVGDQGYTFEFRHFQASLDPEVLEHFVRLCAALVVSAKGLGEPGRPSFNETYDAFGKIEGWKDLLTTIGLQHAISFWEKLLSTYPGPPEDSRSDSSRPSSFLAPLE